VSPPKGNDVEQAVQIARLEERVSSIQIAQADQSRRLEMFADSMTKLTAVVESDTQAKRNGVALWVAVIALIGTIVSAIITVLIKSGG
jgi:D-serine deaminase-like pyridoxal phosphate-dependent protein